MPALDEFDSWPDGPLMLRPSPRAPDVAVTRVARHDAPAHLALPSAAHAEWEASQERAAAADADEDGEEAEAWVPRPGAAVPLNQYAIHFESDLFVGKLLLYVRGLPSSYEPYYAGKKRRSVVMFQARRGAAAEGRAPIVSAAAGGRGQQQLLAGCRGRRGARQKNAPLGRLPCSLKLKGTLPALKPQTPRNPKTQHRAASSALWASTTW
jgi:hypothetical protein